MARTLPTLFLSHGSPMHAIEPGEVRGVWQAIARDLPRPKALLIASAHSAYDTQESEVRQLAVHVALLDRLGPPPRIVWLTCGNTSNARMREVLRSRWQDARALLDAGEELVEIADYLGARLEELLFDEQPAFVMRGAAVNKATDAAVASCSRLIDAMLQIEAVGR